MLATTSANLSNHPSSKTYEQAVSSIGLMVDTVFKDYGYKCLGLESTVILLTENNYKVLRQGAVVVDF